VKIQVTNWVQEILVTFENQSSVTSVALAKSLQNINLRSINLTWCKAISEDSTKNCWKYHYRYSWNTAKVDIKHQSINHYHKYINRWNNTYIFILFLRQNSQRYILGSLAYSSGYGLAYHVVISNRPISNFLILYSERSLLE
jgi:hypothetical protein